MDFARRLTQEANLRKESWNQGYAHAEEDILAYLKECDHESSDAIRPALQAIMHLIRKGDARGAASLNGDDDL